MLDSTKSGDQAATKRSTILQDMHTDTKNFDPTQYNLKEFVAVAKHYDNVFHINTEHLVVKTAKGWGVGLLCAPKITIHKNATVPMEYCVISHPNGMHLTPEYEDNLPKSRNELYEYSGNAVIIPEGMSFPGGTKPLKQSGVYKFDADGEISKFDLFSTLPSYLSTPGIKLKTEDGSFLGILKDLDYKDTIDPTQYNLKDFIAAVKIHSEDCICAFINNEELVMNTEVEGVRAMLLHSKKIHIAESVNLITDYCIITHPDGPTHIPEFVAQLSTSKVHSMIIPKGMFLSNGTNALKLDHVYSYDMDGNISKVNVMRELKLADYLHTSDIELEASSSDSELEITIHSDGCSSSSFE